MFNTPPPAAGDEHRDINRIVAAGPRGALFVAGVATAIVVVLWFTFHLFVFLPRVAP